MTTPLRGMTRTGGAAPPANTTILTHFNCRQRARHQPQVEGLVNAAMSLCPRSGDGDLCHLQGACVVELGAGDVSKLTDWPSQLFICMLLAYIAEPAVMQEREFWAVSSPPAYRDQQFLLSGGTCSARTLSTIIWTKARAAVAAHRRIYLRTLESAWMCLLLIFPHCLLKSRLPACWFAPSTYAEWAQTLPSTALSVHKAGRI